MFHATPSERKKGTGCPTGPIQHPAFRCAAYRLNTESVEWGRGDKKRPNRPTSRIRTRPPNVLVRSEVKAGSILHKRRRTVQHGAESQPTITSHRKEESKSHRWEGIPPRSPVISGELETDLPTGFVGEPGNLHPVSGSSRSWWSTLVNLMKANLSGSGSTSELDCEACSHEIGSVYTRTVSCAW